MTGIMEKNSIYGIVLSILIHILIIALPFRDVTFKTQRTEDSEIKFLIASAKVVPVDKNVQSGKDDTEEVVVKEEIISKKGGKETELTTEPRQEHNIEIAEAEEPENTELAGDKEINSMPPEKEVGYKEIARTADINEVEHILQQKIPDDSLPERGNETIASFNSKPDEPYTGEFGRDNGPKFLKRAPISYPIFARKVGKEGRVLLRLSIDEKGKLDNIKVVSSGGFGFDEAAVEAIKHSTFLPAMRGGKPVRSEVLLTVKFKLRGRSN
jgi:TonB family protein